MREHVEPPPAHHFYSRVPQAYPLHLAQFELFSSLGPRFSLSDSVLVCFHPGFSCQSSLNNPSDPLSESCRFILRRTQRISRTTPHVPVSSHIRTQDVEFSTFNFQRFLDQHSWQPKYRSFFVNCDLLRQLQFWNHHLPTSCQFCFCDHCNLVTICPGSPSQSSKFIDSQASLKVWLIQLWPRTLPFLAKNKNCCHSILVTNKGSLNPSFQSWVQTFFFNLLKPNLLSKLYLQMEKSNSQLVHELHCKMKNPIE